MSSTHLQVYDEKGIHLGHFDGEFFYTSPDIGLRVDGDEVYKTLGGEHFGYLEDDKIIDIFGLVVTHFSHKL